MSQQRSKSLHSVGPNSQQSTLLSGPYGHRSMGRSLGLMAVSPVFWWPSSPCIGIIRPEPNPLFPAAFMAECRVRNSA